MAPWLPNKPHSVASQTQTAIPLEDTQNRKTADSDRYGLLVHETGVAAQSARNV